MATCYTFCVYCVRYTEEHRFQCVIVIFMGCIDDIIRAIGDISKFIAHSQRNVGGRFVCVNGGYGKHDFRQQT